MLRRTLLFLTAVAFAPPGAAQISQTPWKAENLQHSPKDITRERLTQRMREFSFALTRKTVPVGTVRFVVTNAGAIGHNFVVVGRKTRILAPGQRATLLVRFGKGGLNLKRPSRDHFRRLELPQLHQRRGQRVVIIRDVFAQRNCASRSFIEKYQCPEEGTERFDSSPSTQTTPNPRSMRTRTSRLRRETV